MVKDQQSKFIRTDQLNRDVFRSLAEQRSDCCLSIYLPTHQSGKEVNEQEDMLLFKNLLQQAEKLLIARGKNKQLLQPGYDLLKNITFWRNQKQGLAFFITKDTFQTLRLPIPVKEEVYLNNCFLV